MVNEFQAKQIALAFVEEACEATGIDFSTIKASVKPLWGIPRKSILDPATNTIIVSESFFVDCIKKNSFTPLRSEMYSTVRWLYLILHPDELKDKDLIMESLYYGSALVALKGLKIPMCPDVKDMFFAGVERILKDNFNIEASFIQMPEPLLNGVAFYKAQMSDKCTKRYINRYFPSSTRSTTKSLIDGGKGSMSNPFNNVYEAVEYIKLMNDQSHEADTLLQDIEQQKYFYDPVQGQFRIHWASPFVSQYKNNYPARTFFVNQMDTSFFSLKPNLYRCKFLYRGQSDHYEGKPCVPNLYRSEIHNAKRDYLEYLIFSQEMELLIQSHPLVKLLERGVELLHDLFRIRMNYSGLTQHYYNKSRFLDFSSDLEVMKFFATTGYDCESDSYYPYMKTNNLGVIYCYELQYPSAFQQHKGYAVKTIGKQPFMRPGAQCGFLLDMEQGVDLKTLPEVTALYFRHDPEISKKIFQQSSNGEEYFATDLLQHAWRDRLCTRRDKRIVSRKTVEYNANLNQTTPNDIIDKLAAIDITVDDFELKFTNEEMNLYYNDIQNGWWQTFCEDIHFYGAEDELYREALRLLPKDHRYEWAFKR